MSLYPLAYKSRIALLGALACFIQACGDCSKPCPAFNTAYLTVAPYNTGDTVHFRDDAGHKIDFLVDNKYASEGYQLGGQKQAMGGCKIGDCEAQAVLAAHSDAVRNGSNQLLVQMNAASAPSVFEVLGFRGAFYPGGKFEGATGEVEQSGVLVGQARYPSVLIFTVDTLQPPFRDQSIWQVYFSRYGGVVGFRDRQTQSLYYLAQ